MKPVFVFIHVWFVFFANSGEAAILLRHSSKSDNTLYSERPAEVKEVWRSKEPGAGATMLNDQSRQAAPCEDKDDRCASWAQNGECEKNPSYMHASCQRSCKVCFVDGSSASASIGPLASGQIKDTPGGTKVAVHIKDASWMATWWHVVTIALWSFLPYTIMVFIFAFVWMKLDGRLEPFGARRNNGQDFAFGLCALDHCLSDHMWICICSFFCTSIRMADTYSKAAQDYNVPRAIIPGFWKALCVVLAMQFLIILTGFLGIILFVCIAVFFRQKLRRVYALPNCTGKVLAWDCLFWCCCPWCTIAQECRQVQFVTEQPTKQVPISYQRDNRAWGAP